MALDPAKVKAGETSFQTTCAACHGFNAMGIPGLGKPLIGSKFVNGLTDDQLLAFLQKGRDLTDPLNTTGVVMPPRGGNPSFTDDKLVEIIAYIRTLNAGSQAASGAAPTAASATSSAPVATDVPYVFKPLDLSGLPVPTNVSPSENAQPAKTGESLYVQSCSGCHGVHGKGVAPIAEPLSASDLLKNHDGIGLLNFLTKAEPPISPLDKFPHPYRGGYPELSDADLQSIMVYLYSLTTGK
jgi:disulfide bond formation protein DsbB